MSLINSKPQNSVLEQAQQKIESQLDPKIMEDYRKVVVSGMRVALDKGPNSIMASLQKSKNPLSDCAIGAINLVLLLRKQSRNTMPMKALVPGAMTLMLQALDFADRTGLLKVGNGELVQATHIFTSHIFKMLNITGPMLQTAAQKIRQITSDPASVEKMQHAAGTMKAPGAAAAAIPQESANGAH